MNKARLLAAYADSLEERAALVRWNLEHGSWRGMEENAETIRAIEVVVDQTMALDEVRFVQSGKTVGRIVGVG